MELKRQSRRADAGFSMIEMMVVAAIILIISAMAMPNIWNSVQIMRMRSSLTEITGLYQQTRRLAVRDAKIYPVRTTTIGGRLAFYADLNPTATSTYQSGYPAVVMPEGVTVISTPGSTTGLDVSTVTVTGTMPGFNNRGLPCTYAATYDCPFLTNISGTFYPSHFAIYLQTRNGGTMAVVVEPSGQVRGYIWSGTSFQ
jgi:prepilin-type N-terminal cleavage/methylation domain-containing protein